MYCFVYSILTHEMLKSSYVFGFKVLIFVQCTLAELDIILPLAAWSYRRSLYNALVYVRSDTDSYFSWLPLGQFLHNSLYFVGFCDALRSSRKNIYFWIILKIHFWLYLWSESVYILRKHASLYDQLILLICFDVQRIWMKLNDFIKMLKYFHLFPNEQAAPVDPVAARCTLRIFCVYIFLVKLSWLLELLLPYCFW